MGNYLQLSPKSEDYLRSSEVYQNLTYNTKTLTLGANMLATTTPSVALDSFGGAKLKGQITINTGSPSANMTLCTLPANLVPQADAYLPVVVLRSGAYVANAVKVTASSGAIVLLTQPNQNDVVCLDNVEFLVNAYS